MTFRILTLLLLLSLTSCSSVKRSTASTDALTSLKIEYQIKDIKIHGRLQIVNMDLYPPHDVELELPALLVFKNNSTYQVELKPNTDGSYKLHTTIPFIFDPTETKLRISTATGPLIEEIQLKWP